MFNLEANQASLRKKAFFPYSLEGAAYLIHVGGLGGGCVSWMSAPPRVRAAGVGGAVLGTEKVHQKGVKGLGSGDPRPAASSARVSAVCSGKGGPGTQQELFKR